MKPVVICRYAPHEGPGYFATYLTSRRIAWRVAKLDEGEALPHVDSIGGLAMMGGAMSVNDELPWIAPMRDLIRASVEAGVPVIGHCLGGQLLASALGAPVTPSPVPEIGWGEVHVEGTAQALAWGPPHAFLGYHWHGETFAIPRGAVRIWSSAHCENQAFVLGPHIGMQCHIEMTHQMIESWCETGAAEIEDAIRESPAVQRREDMLANAPSRLEALHGVAGRVYARWVEGLKAT